MHFDLDTDTINFLKIILSHARVQKKRIFFVGGIVRDNLLNLKTKDIDLLLEGDAVAFSKTLPEKIKIKSIHKDFYTVKLKYKDIELDLASSRTEHYSYSGSLPVVDKIGVSIEDDIKRRDFTINSLYAELSLNEGLINYRLIDLINGVSDIKNKTLKVLHNKSYIDDPTRILRGLNFKYRFKADFSPSDKKLIDDYLNHNIQYDKMSTDRILSVFKIVLSNEFHREIFNEIIDKKYYKILSSKDITVNKIKLSNCIKKFSEINNFSDFYLMILKDIGIEKIKFSKFFDFYKYFIKKPASFIAYYYYKTADEGIIEYLNKKDIKLFLKGSNLIEAGYKEGKNIGLILDNLLDKKLQNKDQFLSLEDELNWVKTNYPIL